ncbi:hypothetical protein GWL_11750 [Herbaspirillum sp. GW103]|nr:hypothetical protein GWL_11750 [Herbaspirillum sp. GW103]
MEYAGKDCYPSILGNSGGMGKAGHGQMSLLFPSVTFSDV